MPKVITSPVKKWPGTVTLADPLSYPQYLAWEDALLAARAYQQANGDAATQAHYDAILLTGVRPCVEKWELNSGFTPDPFPANPRLASARLVGWLVHEIDLLANEADEAPNASAP